ncbi:NAD(P)H-dependent oxidoreductase [Asaia krungthepensis]|uniref:NADH/NADPH dehydrogenase n=1 Tax=Asaia krungthepensis NRIC 0535 TaxID=1307925 RepID=A0ABQ0Q3F3_9PROT|nr:NAD(P)H-dependent oxidoreductase [Asaia krungthepensis]GBQ89471.1 NADH/NADPH dehydrogenase [Asaia krungthepensis NRIC 0535]
MSRLLIIHAHPEPRSLSSALKDVAVETLTAQGHEVQVSDLYAMNWKAVADSADFTTHSDSDRLHYAAASKTAYQEGTQAADILAEQQKLLWADGVILNFPLWWFGLPAILKGWIDRVYACGFAYGVGAQGGARWGDRYGEGTLMGKRAMLAVTLGGREPHYTDRGVNGRLFDVLWPIQHGILFYPGMSVLPPFALYQADRLDDARWVEARESFQARLKDFFTEIPIAFRTQNGGDYDEQQVLREGLGSGKDGLMIHLSR